MSIKKQSFIVHVIICIAIFLTVSCTEQQPPRVTIIFVVDQLAYHYFPRLAPYFKHGLKLLLDTGINYTNALHPHGMPSTSTGHTGLSTGTFAADHGIIGNKWYDIYGNIVRSDDDISLQAAVLSPAGTYNYGKSAHKIMVDGLSDQFVRTHTLQSPHYAYGISLKSRAAILTANKLGKALWFDSNAGRFTSSKAYFDSMPPWLDRFNSMLETKHSDKFAWKPMYRLNGPAYALARPDGYVLSGNGGVSLINKTFPFKDIQNKKGKEFDHFMQLPHANQLLLDLTRVVMQEHKTTDNLLLWVCLSSLDKVGHTYGPNSYETIDMLYYLDQQLGLFINDVFACYGKEQVLFVLTADHGVSPIIELVRQQGYRSAQRIPAQILINQLNQAIEKQFDYRDLIIGYKTPQFYCNQAILASLKPETHSSITQFIRKELMQHSGVKQVWTFDELKNKTYQPYALENFFKQQLFKGRSGTITVQTFPYVQITEYTTGTNHQTPYWYDTHVPLMLYRPGLIESKTITQKVLTLQLANSLADLLHIERPSASIFDPLPGIDYGIFMKALQATSAREYSQ